MKTTDNKRDIGGRACKPDSVQQANRKTVCLPRRSFL